MAMDNLEEKKIPQVLVEPPLIHDLTEYWGVFVSKVWIILPVTAACLFASSFYYNSLPNLYTATAKILVEPVDEAPKSHADNLVTSSTGEDDYYGTQIALLTGRKIRGLVESGLTKPISYSVTASRIRDTRILTVSVTDRDPQMAAKIANSYAENYVQQSKQETAFIGQQLLQWLPSNGEISQAALPTMPVKGVDKKEFAESLSSVSDDQQLQQMRAEKLQLQSKLSELTQRYKEEYPAVKEVRERLSAVETVINERTTTILNVVRANLAGEIRVTNIKVLEDAQVPGSPSAPNRASGVLTWTLSGFLLSTLLVFFLEYANQKIRTENDVHDLGLTFLGYVPLVRSMLKNKFRESRDGGPSSSLMGALKNNAVLSDSVASVRTHILFSMPYERSRRIMVTSAIPSEGKSTISALLALSLSALGRKILIIDADLRKPYLHHYLQVPNHKGLTEYLIGSATSGEILQKVPESGLHIITAGSASPNPSELLASERFRQLLDEMEGMFDRVVIDVPPILYIPDGLVVAKYVHTGVLICGAGMVHKRTIRQLKEKLDSINYVFVGAVVNRADLEREGYRYKYYSDYKGYYSHHHKR